MNNNDQDLNDEQLHELFSLLRMEEQLHAPRFSAGSSAASSVPPAPVRRPLGRTLAGTFACALAIIATILWLRHEPPSHAPSRQTGAPVASITAWKPPTDFLLNTPGSEMLRTPPALELRPYLGAMPSLTQPAPRVRKRPSR